MAKLIRHDFGAIHDALNKLIIAEVKTALELLQGKTIKSDWSLCRIVVSDIDDYRPEDVSVNKVTLDAAGELHIWGMSEQYGACLFDEDETDWLDITDFAYLIDQIAERVEENGTVCGHLDEAALIQTIEKRL